MDSFIKVGSLSKVSDDGKTIEVLSNKILYRNVPVLHKSGFYSKLSTDSTVILLFINGSNNAPVAVVGDSSAIPNLNQDELKIRVNDNAMIHIDKEGVINITGKQVIANGDNVLLGDGSAKVLNENAVLTVNITGGSSAGQYPVNIDNAGQDKVSA